MCKIMLNMCVVEKFVVLYGGGYNYCYFLFDVILIKDNYIVVVGGVRYVLEVIKCYVSYMMVVEIEVD